MENQHPQATLIITREFNAPKETVFNAFADAEALAQWWGPPGMPITVVKFEFKPGGIFLYKATMQGQTLWGRFIYKQIKRPDLLEFISSFTDENGGITRAPFSELFPLEIFNRLEFSEHNGKTIIKLTGYPIHATNEELRFYQQNLNSFQQGFAGTFSQLDQYLTKVSK